MNNAHWAEWMRKTDPIVNLLYEVGTHPYEHASYLFIRGMFEPGPSVMMLEALLLRLPARDLRHYGLM